MLFEQVLVFIRAILIVHSAGIKERSGASIANAQQI